jgi:hypothetical protein
MVTNEAILWLCVCVEMNDLVKQFSGITILQIFMDMFLNTPQLNYFLQTEYVVFSLVYTFTRKLVQNFSTSSHNVDFEGNEIPGN